MIAYLILTIVYFLWTRALLPRLPADLAGLAAVGVFKWVLLFFIGLTFARAFCRYYRLRRLPAALTIPVALCAGASVSMLWCGATSPKYVSKHGRGH